MQTVSTFSFCSIQTILDDFPINNIPYGFDIVRAYIAVAVQNVEYECSLG